MKGISTFILLMNLLLLGCGDDQPVEMLLKVVTHEVLYFEYTEDTGNNSSRLRYAITFTNPNDVEVTGFYTISINADGVETTQLSSNTSPYYTINKNSQCTYYFEEEDSHDLGMIKMIELVAVECILED